MQMNKEYLWKTIGEFSTVVFGGTTSDGLALLLMKLDSLRM